MLRLLDFCAPTKMRCWSFLRVMNCGSHTTMGNQPHTSQLSYKIIFPEAEKYLSTNVQPKCFGLLSYWSNKGIYFLTDTWFSNCLHTMNANLCKKLWQGFHDKNKWIQRWNFFLHKNLLLNSEKIIIYLLTRFH